MPETQRRGHRGPAREVAKYAETGAGIALATGAAHAADWIRNVPSPQAGVMPWACAATLIFGFGWGAWRLVVPRSVAEH
jgi:hypothetical protein